MILNRLEQKEHNPWRGREIMSSTFTDDFLCIVPLPPPWILISPSGTDPVYFNDLTKESISEHPLRRILRCDNEESPQENKEITKDNFEDAVLTTTTSQSQPENSITEKKKKQRKFSDYRCTWKEIGLFGDVNSYTIVLRYFEDDGTTVVKLDGLDAQWQCTHMEGPYGPIDKYDLFIGAKVNIFGRHMSITSSSSTMCHWNEVERRKLMKKQEWLRSKIEAMGVIPVVKRLAPLQHKSSKEKPEGHADLRRLLLDNGKLGEQLAQLGNSNILATTR